MAALSRLVLQNGTPLIVQKEIVDQVGMIGALILQQIHYFSTIDNPNLGKFHEGRKWIYNSYEAWAAHLGSSVTTIGRTIRKLKKMGLILSDMLHHYKGNRTQWYVLNYEALKELCPHRQGDTVVVSKRQDHYKETETTSKEGLKNACATETSETLSPLIAEEALEIVKKTIDRAANEPLVVKTELFAKTITKRVKSHFGTLDNWRAYCTKIASNLFLMGKKPMKSGDMFKLSVGSLLSKKMIEDSWENKGFFTVYPPKQAKQHTPPDTKPQTLTLEEAIQTTDNEQGRKVISRLFKELGAATYLSWFHANGFEAIGLKDGEPYFYLKGNHARDYVNTHLSEYLKRAFREAERV